MPIVKASHVYKVFGKREHEVIKRLEAGEDRSELAGLGTAAVIDANFEVERGEIFVVMGLSGSGKSTLLRTVNGLGKATSGSIEINGNEIAQMNNKEIRAIRAKHISMVFQHFALMPHRTVRENAAYALEIQGVPKTERLERANTWLQTVGLAGWGDKYPHELSGGMQQRVGLARALAAETEILLMDEAFSALDPLIRREMQDQLIELQQQLGKTIIFITHDLNEAMYLGDRIAVMRDGRIVQIGTAEDILTNPADEYIANFVQDVDRARVLTASTVMRQIDDTVMSGAGPRVAMRAMESNGWNILLVTDRERKLLGYVTDRAVVNAARAGERTIEGIVETEGILTVGPDTPVSELFAPSSASRVPLCVVAEDGRFLGIVPRVNLLNSMAQVSPTTGEIPAVQTLEQQPGDERRDDEREGEATKEAE
ncbi:glycine betaine/L-proline ABC transporter ATP-binding protein [Brevibacterium sp. 91QC2O2]|uniref:quaternary amine ABC transporter ATP-binding protein n=1 Tax=Brevibacterium sp. 91QC2O2 TaxID=2968458 RepID=UPI00211CDAC9|nr:glycine betaine/L-proline ABC transporter ATP-binding protein [Brevibacterium sp. 91QC2O2]MCQ9369291.1 glycine betaine/L-proline ABC transporter ATP-binding protein [Brevibacterium sp. 91QC2O2]